MTSSRDLDEGQKHDEAFKDQISPTFDRKRNAFSELMSPKPKQAKQIQPQQHNHPRDARNGLLPYILNPTSFSSDIVIQHNENTVLIRDAFPKATVHLLLLPRDSTKWHINPRDALDDEVFLAMVQKEAAEALQLAASELSRLIGPYSESCKARIAAMESDDPPAELPAGRDFSQEFKVGVHAHPSMNHLHVHIISRDMYSERLKHQKHYNSFNTDFFIPLGDFPLAKGDPRRQTSYQNANLKKDYKCWRCGRSFANKFTALKAHLQEEFIAWRKE
ncbi:hypothetical protein G647_07955 [Cladophialophora carrionii CBS 160.54]|uniref:Aprataxin-like protein n=1 Tax=Cladophialophora carrionii CBS 160.54 TaxID=1279043 RepID=V9D5N5_9EURO|nr:uncharacterized protein G647_07955 [Cladophialophora carrionii CBS 160.54]ETI21608.1 hypothetical protein G647_07955 [Cladophialophora carrionii CBS 160.54]